MEITFGEEYQDQFIEEEKNNFELKKVSLKNDASLLNSLKVCKNDFIEKKIPLIKNCNTE